ncbi:UbiA prenyltransferase family-domain-containing protein [Lentinula edodes]|uniref:UbiA prenyltransferase n=1 Tax=Lentinula edodes TaxID=5353 RepID=UPI001E8CB828|nr:UbiA prenyltransferase [Lentinula edodes]KAH7872831.1 UbiA prenyltransferase [Lentinula edodes]KAJ3901169.1 UbiA prenyltransferase family-domain-containing protein [Lentinula edodes]KAJ3916148.1 UbiA prenyltransferase family-domain-containing protein [Lentinula edodes]
MSKRLANLFASPSKEELNACWELCRLNNNMGCWTTWIPTAWALAMVYHAQPQIPGALALMWAAKYFVLCSGIKSLIMTIDDILDHDIDVMVVRTKNRAIPRGAISLDRAWLFFGLQVVLGVCLAQALLDPVSRRFAAAAAPLFVIYPTCKRWMYFAPVTLGLMFTVGVFMGWSTLSLTKQLPYEILIPVYIGGCCWVWTYETIYQHMDKVDDVKIGIRSSALLCGRYTIPVCSTTAIAFFGLLTYGGYLNGHSYPFFAGVLLAAALLMSKLLRTDIECPADCRDFFLQTPLIGQIIVGGFAADAVIARISNGIAL